MVRPNAGLCESATRPGRLRRPAARETIGPKPTPPSGSIPMPLVRREALVLIAGAVSLPAYAAPEQSTATASAFRSRSRAAYASNDGRVGSDLNIRPQSTVLPT